MSRITTVLRNSTVIVACLLLVTFANGEDKKEESSDGIKIYKRLIPADVLRGMISF